MAGGSLAPRPPPLRAVPITAAGTADTAAGTAAAAAGLPRPMAAAAVHRNIARVNTGSGTSYWLTVSGVSAGKCSR